MSAHVEEASSVLFEFLSVMKECNDKFATLFKHGGTAARDQARSSCDPSMRSI